MDDDVGKSPRQERIAPPQQPAHHPFARPFLCSPDSPSKKHQKRNHSSSNLSLSSSSSTLSLSSRRRTRSSTNNHHNNNNNNSSNNSSPYYPHLNIQIPTLSSQAQDCTPTSCYPSPLPRKFGADPPSMLKYKKKKCKTSTTASSTSATPQVSQKPQDVISPEILHISIAGPRVLPKTTTTITETPIATPALITDQVEPSLIRTGSAAAAAATSTTTLGGPCSASSPSRTSEPKKNLAARIIRRTLAFNQSQPSDSPVSSSDEKECEDAAAEKDKRKDDYNNTSNKSPSSSPLRPLFPRFHAKRAITSPQLFRGGQKLSSSKQQQQPEQDHGNQQPLLSASSEPRRRLHRSKRPSSISSRISWVTSPRPSPTTVYRHSIGKDMAIFKSPHPAYSYSSSLSSPASSSSSPTTPPPSYLYCNSNGRLVLLNQSQIDASMMVSENVGDIHISLLSTPPPSSPVPYHDIHHDRDNNNRNSLNSTTFSCSSTIVNPSPTPYERPPRQRWTRDSHLDDLSRSSSITFTTP